MKRFAVLIICAVMLLSLAAPALAITPSYQVSDSYAGSEYCRRLLEVDESGSQVADLLNIALSQLGYHEGEQWDYSGSDPLGNSNYTEYGYAFPYDGAQWCAMFIDWCARQAGIPRSEIGHTSLANPNYFGLYYYNPRAYAPKTGDLVFFGRGSRWAHVAIVLAATDEYLFTVDGNSNDAVRLNSYRRDSDFIKAYAPWTNAECDMQALGLERLCTLLFSPNGGEGRMQSVYVSNLRPVSLYVNQIELDDDTGDPLFEHYIYREGLSFCGWYVQRDSDGAWLTDNGFVSGEALAADGLERTVIADGGAVFPDAIWSGESFPRFTLHAVWRDSDGGTDYDKSAYIPRADSSGWVNPFWDLKESRWYYESVKRVLASGLMEGMNGTTFSPEGTLTRAQAVMLLYRIAGCPEAAQPCPFTDVAREAWYAGCIDWAYTSGCVDGMSEYIFAPDEPVTKHQFLALLCRMETGAPLPQHGVAAEEPSDDDVPDWAAPGVQWASEKGLDTAELSAISGSAPLIRGACAGMLDLLYCGKAA